MSGVQKFIVLLLVAVCLITRLDENIALFLLMFGNGKEYKKKFLLDIMILFFYRVIWITLNSYAKHIKRHAQKKIEKRKKRFAALQRMRELLFFLTEKQFC